MTAKETAKLNSKHFPDEIKKPLKAGGPGSGRKPVNQTAHDKLIKQGYIHRGNAWSHDIGKYSYYEKLGKANKYGTATVAKERHVTSDGVIHNPDSDYK
jgi:hypothetical protein